MQHIFPEGMLLHEELNTFKGIAVKKMCAFIVTKFFLISRIILTHIALLPTVYAHHLRDYVQLFE